MESCIVDVKVEKERKKEIIGGAVVVGGEMMRGKEAFEWMPIMQEFVLLFLFDSNNDML